MAKSNKIIIQSDTLRNLNRIDSHKKITSILRGEIETKIHSLEIKIKDETDLPKLEVKNSNIKFENVFGVQVNLY